MTTILHKFYFVESVYVVYGCCLEKIILTQVNETSSLLTQVTEYMRRSLSSKYLGGGSKRGLGDPLRNRSNLTVKTLTKGLVRPGFGYLKEVHFI